MTENKINNVPIINEDKKVCGLIAMKHIAKFIISGDSKNLNATYDNILESLEATSILKYNDLIEGTINIAAYKSQTFIDNVKTDNSSIVLVGDRYKVLEHAINNNAKLIIITGNNEIPE